MNHRIHLAILFFLVSETAISAQSWADSLLQWREEFTASLQADPRLAFDTEDLAGLQWYAPAKEFVVGCDVQLSVDSSAVEIPTYSGMLKSFRPVALLECSIQDIMITLTVYAYVAPGMQSRLAPLFLPYKDYTNGDDTYGGGRYINISRDLLKADTWLLDFNWAYNPLCAYGDGFNCPIPPPANHLTIEIRAGEMDFRGTYKSKTAE